MQTGAVWTVCSIALVVVAIVTHWWFVSVVSGTGTGAFTVHFLSVGQGDAILLETPHGKQILVDGGRGGAVIRALGEVLPSHDDTIDIVIATHPDADHIGGLVGVLDRFHVDTIIHTGATTDTRVYKSFAERIAHEVTEGAREYVVQEPMHLTIDGVTISLLWPIFGLVGDSNAGSIVLVARYGDAGVFLSGDAPEVVEGYVVDQFSSLLSEIEVVKAGHHGSKTSTGEALLSVTQPTFVIVSAGEANQYGHPHDSVITRIKESGAFVVETKDGTSTFSSMGEPFAEFVQQ